MDKALEIPQLPQAIENALIEVASTHMPYILTRNNHPAVVMIAYEDYLKLLSREDIWTRFEKTWAELGELNAGYSEAEIEADLQAATQEVRARRQP